MYVKVDSVNLSDAGEKFIYECKSCYSMDKTKLRITNVLGVLVTTLLEIRCSRTMETLLSGEIGR